QAALALHDGEHACLAAAMNGVDLPVTTTAAPLDDRWSLGDELFAGQSATTVVPSVAFAPTFARPAQMPPQASSGGPIGPDAQVDGLVTHDRQALAPAAPDDLRRTPILLQPPRDRREVRRTIASIAPRPAPTPVRHLHSHVRAIRQIVGRLIAPQFPVDRRAMSTQRTRDHRSAAALLPQDRDLISFPTAELSICHRPEMSHLLPES